MPFSKHIPTSIDTLSTDDIYALTLILRHPPNISPADLPKTAHLLIPRLPPHLRRQSSPFPLRISLLSRNLPQPVCSLLCPTHKDLNAQQIHMLYAALMREVGPHLNTLQGNKALLPATAQAALEHLRGINALVMPVADYIRLTLESPPAGRVFQADGCEACVLTTVGGDVPALVALRATVRSRRRKHKKNPQFLRVVDAWIGHFGPEELRDRMWRESGVVKKMFRGLRREAQLERRGQRERDPEKASLSDDEGKELAEEDSDKENDERDPQGEVVDVYLQAPNGFRNANAGRARPRFPASSVYSQMTGQEQSLRSKVFSPQAEQERKTQSEILSVLMAEAGDQGGVWEGRGEIAPEHAHEVPHPLRARKIPDEPQRGEVPRQTVWEDLFI